MAEISFNNKYNQMNKLNQQFYDSYFEDKYDSTKPMDQQSNSLTMKSLGDGSTTPDFAAMQSAYADAQKSKTKNSFFSMSADAAMPDNFSGLQNSMGGITLNPDGSLNYNNTQPQNLGFRSMVDMANNANNFNSQFASPGRFSGMGQMGPNKSNMNAPQIASPRTVIDQNRIPGRIQEAVEPSTRFRDASNMAEYLQGNPQIMDNIQNTIGSGIDKFKSGLGSIKDFAMDKGRMGRNLLGSAGAMALGLPGMVGSGVMSLLSGLGNGADYQQYTPGFDYNGLNDSMINDFFDPATGLNRFDRARKKGNTFASARTGADYFKARREKKAAAATAEAKRQSDLRTVQQRAARGDSYSDIGRDMYTGQGQAFAKQSGGSSGKKGTSTERNYGGRKDGGRIGYNQGGLASMFTRKR